MRLSSGIFQILLIACAGAAQAQSWRALDGTMRKAEAARPELAGMMATAKVPGLGMAVIECRRSSSSAPGVRNNFPRTGRAK
jgi:hypothetical protein